MSPPVAKADDEGIRAGDGNRGWSAAGTDSNRAPVGVMAASASVQAQRGKVPSPEILRRALLRFFEGAPKGSDAAAGLGIMEDDDGSRYLPFSILGKAVGLTDE